MDAWLADLRFAARVLARSRGATTAAVLALVLGIGACTAVFSVVNGVLLRSLPYPDSERMVSVAEVGGRGQRMSFADPNFEDLRAATRSFVALAQCASGEQSVSGGQEPVRTVVAAVSEDFYAVAGVGPAVGRAFAPEETRPGGPPVAIVSHGFWQRSLGGVPDVSSARLRFDGRVHAVVGVMPRGFSLPAGTDVWVPRGLQERLPSRTAHNWPVLGRLAPGVSLEQARSEVTAIARRLKAEHGDDTWMVDAVVTPLRESLTGAARPTLQVLAGAVGFLLLVACANVANLRLAQAAGRARELAIRLAVGAGRAQLVRQLVTEALLLGGLGAAGGVLLAAWGTKALLALAPGTLPRAEEIGIDGTVLAFAAGLGLATALGVGLVVSWRATRDAGSVSLHEVERSAAGGRGRLTLDALVLFQVAATAALLVGSGLLGRSLWRLLSVDPGFHTGSVLAMDLSITTEDSGPEGLRRRVDLAEAITAGLRALPGVEEAGVANVVPLGGSGADGIFLVTDREMRGFEEFETLSRDPAVTGEAEFRIAGPGYFKALGIPLLKGRLFSDGDGPDTPHVAVISQSLARKRWPERDPLGLKIQYGNMDGDLRLFTIVGVVGDVREAGLDREPRPTFYALHRQRPRGAPQLSFVARTTSDPAAFAAAARAVVRGLAPELPPRFRTLEEIRDASLADRRLTLWLLGTFGLAALVLAALGIYGVTSYAVARRTREVGIRMALGAQAGQVLGLVLAEGARPVAGGVALGLLAALALGRLMSSLLFGVSPGDPGTALGVAVVLGLVALLATYIPARRATRVDPMAALRAE